MNFHKFYSCAKLSNFYAENEYRFLIFSNMKPDFRLSDNRQISYLKVSIKDKKLPITGVIISPFTSDEPYNNTIRKFLFDNKYENVSIISSELHLRKS